MNHNYQNSPRYHELLQLAATTDEPAGMLTPDEMSRIPHLKVEGRVITESGWLYRWDDWYGRWVRKGREV